MYSRCPVCRRNHTEGRKHVYKVGHQKKLRAILDKAAGKLRAVLPLRLESPVVVRPTAQQPGAPSGAAQPCSPEPNYWCWFCEQDIDNSNNKFLSEATFRHLSSRSHHEAVHEFWKTAGAPAQEKEQFLLSETQWEQYEEACKRAAQRHAEEEAHRRQAEEEHILSLISGDLPPPSAPTSTFDYLSPAVPVSPSPLSSCSTVAGFPSSGDTRRNLYPSPQDRTFIGPHGPPQRPSALVKDPLPSWGTTTTIQTQTSPTPSVPRQTAIAFGENLTSIVVPKLRAGEGNIHTGAKPPWLRDDEDSSVSRGVVALPLTPREELRRTIQQLEAQKKAAKTAKNPNRVGGWYVEMKKRRKAQGEQLDEGSDWLPSFGGVWNEGPRSQHARKHRALDNVNKPTRARGQRPASTETNQDVDP